MTEFISPNYELMLRDMPLYWIISVTVALSLLALAAWSDLATRTIPDWISAVLALLGLGLRAADGLSALAASFGIAGVLFMALAALHARGIIGGGDVKLIAALALGLAPIGTSQMLFGIACAGGVLAILYLALRALPAPKPPVQGAGTLRRVIAAERWRSRRRGPLPYAVAIACGGAWVLLTSSGIGV